MRDATRCDSMCVWVLRFSYHKSDEVTCFFEIGKWLLNDWKRPLIQVNRRLPSLLLLKAYKAWLEHLMRTPSTTENKWELPFTGTSWALTVWQLPFFKLWLSYEARKMKASTRTVLCDVLVRVLLSFRRPLAQRNILAMRSEDVLEIHWYCYRLVMAHITPRWLRA